MIEDEWDWIVDADLIKLGMFGIEEIIVFARRCRRRNTSNWARQDLLAKKQR
jgi:hypothetical protein